jgi:hypothetical protein
MSNRNTGFRMLLFSVLTLISFSFSSYSAASVLMFRSIFINNLQVIDTSSSSSPFLTSFVMPGVDYKLRVNVKNVNATDTYWYDNLQIRVVPKNTSTQFFKDCNYSATMSRYDSTLFQLKSKQTKWHTICFRWSGPVTTIDSVDFNIGVYGHELPIQRAWKTLSSPI